MVRMLSACSGSLISSPVAAATSSRSAISSDSGAATCSVLSSVPAIMLAHSVESSPALNAAATSGTGGSTISPEIPTRATTRFASFNRFVKTLAGALVTRCKSSTVLRQPYCCATGGLPIARSRSSSITPASTTCACSVRRDSRSTAPAASTAAAVGTVPRAPSPAKDSMSPANFSHRSSMSRLTSASYL